MAERASESAARARRYFLEGQGRYGCAESAFMALKHAYGLADPEDSAPAMALNGGVAYSGGLCGVITGASLAVGMLAERRIADHATAKLVARELVAATIDAFVAQFGTTDCRRLTGYDLRAPGGHAAFVESGVWRDACARQLESVVERLAALADPIEWDGAVSTIET